ncbi:MAG: hypothetical protein HGB23_07315 [Chlorobiaceae bacterium]|nr:hypothetical protein [Chlorobiaceae bacterium]
MLKEAAGIGGAILLTPLGVPIALHGIAGILVGGAGLFVVDAVLKQTENIILNPKTRSETGDTEE